MKMIAYIKHKNLSIKDVIADLRISRSALYDYEAGRRQPSIKVAEKFECYSNGEVTAQDYYASSTALIHSNQTEVLE